MTLANLVTVRGTLAEAFLKLEPATIQHASEIMNERRANEELRLQWLWTADFALYTVEGRKAVLYLGSRDTNPIFRNIRNATDQLMKIGNYSPSKEDIATVINANSTIRAELPDLSLRGSLLSGLGFVGVDPECPEWQYFEIGISGYPNRGLNNVQKALVERAYGSMEAISDEENWTASTDFRENMKMLLGDVGTRTPRFTPRFYSLNPKYVKRHVKEGTAICRACWLGGFGNYSIFDASGRGVGDPLIGLRGVRKAEGWEPKTEGDTTPGYAEMYATLIANQEEAAQHLTRKTATGLLGLANRYFQTYQEQ